MKGSSAVLGAVFLLQASCGSEEFRLVRLDSFERPLAINEAVVLTFSREISRWCVSPGSLRIERVKDGVPARGEYVVDGQVIRFVPAFPLAGDLSDAGLLLATRYRVIMQGLPHLSCIESVDREPLAITLECEFETMPDDSPCALVDPRADEEALILGYHHDDAAVYVTVSKPVDPRSLKHTVVRLLGPRGYDRSDQQSRLPLTLVENGERAVIAARFRDVLRGEGGVQEGHYRMVIEDDGEGFGLRDFGGRSVALAPDPDVTEFYEFSLMAAETDGR